MLDVFAIRQERQALERQLRDDPSTDPRVLKVLYLRELETLYMADAGATSQPRVRTDQIDHSRETAAPWPSSAASHSRGTGKVNRPMNPDRLRVIEQAANLIRGRARPTKTADIYDMMDDEVRGLIRGNDPKANLSAMLHHSPAFISHSRAGWTLADEEPEGTAPDTSSPAALHKRSEPAGWEPFFARSPREEEDGSL